MKNILYILLLFSCAAWGQDTLYVNCDSTISAIYERHTNPKYFMKGERINKKQLFQYLSRYQESKAELDKYKKINKKYAIILGSATGALILIGSISGPALPVVMPFALIGWFLVDLHSLMKLSTNSNHLKESVILYNKRRCK